VGLSLKRCLNFFDNCLLSGETYVPERYLLFFTGLSEGVNLIIQHPDTLALVRTLDEGDKVRLGDVLALAQLLHALLHALLVVLANQQLDILLKLGRQSWDHVKDVDRVLRGRLASTVHVIELDFF
jgi:hypothetical protein